MAALEKMAGHTRLYRRGATYYHRAAIPKDIAETYPKTEETFSLKTKDYPDALRKVRIAALEVDQRFDAHRIALSRQSEAPLETLTPEQVAAIKSVYISHLLEEDEVTRLLGFEGERTPPNYEPRPTFEEYGEQNEDLDALNRYDYARGISSRFFESEVEEVLCWEPLSLRVRRGSTAYQQAVRALQEATIEASELERSRNAGNVIPTPPAPDTTKPVLPITPLLSEAVAEWLAEKTRSGWGNKAEADYTSWLAMFVEVVGDRALHEYRKEDARAFKSILMKLPANSRKKPKLRNLSFRDAAERAEQLCMEPMSAATVNKGLNRVAAFWAWAEAHYDDVRPGLINGLRVRVTTAARDQRNPFGSHELQALFASPLFVGCKSERFCSQPGPLIMNDTARYWLPLLGLFTGGRLNEPCQLRTANVATEDGVALIEISTEFDDQKLKTANSNRRIPIHPQLLELGFLDFALSRKAERLFPELTQDASGYYSDAFSKFFSAHLKRIGIKTAKTSFHSFRHNFEDACRNSEIPPQIMDALQGHAERGMASRYGDGKLHVSRLKKHVDNIAYPQLDLSRLPRFRAT